MGDEKNLDPPENLRFVEGASEDKDPEVISYILYIIIFQNTFDFSYIKFHLIVESLAIKPNYMAEKKKVMKFHLCP